MSGPGAYVPGMTDPIDYTVAGPLTSLEDVSAAALEPLPRDAAGICRPVHGLVIQPGEATALGTPGERLAENQIRPVGRLISALLALDPAPWMRSASRAGG
jgi:hypothetical protein